MSAGNKFDIKQFVSASESYLDSSFSFDSEDLNIKRLQVGQSRPSQQYKKR